MNGGDYRCTGVSVNHEPFRPANQAKKETEREKNHLNLLFRLARFLIDSNTCAAIISPIYEVKTYSQKTVYTTT